MANPQFATQLVKQEAGDALVGCDAYVDEMFGDELSEDDREKRRRQVNHMLASGHLPGRKSGGYWLGSRAALRAFLVGAGP